MTLFLIIIIIIIILRFFQIADAAADRCVTFTMGFSATGLSSALDEYFKGLFIFFVSFSPWKPSVELFEWVY